MTNNKLDLEQLNQVTGGVGPNLPKPRCLTCFSTSLDPVERLIENGMIVWVCKCNRCGATQKIITGTAPK